MHENAPRGRRLPAVALPAITFLASLAAAATPAHATCGSTQCFLVTDTSQGLNAAGSFRLDLSFQSIEQSRKLQGTDSVSDVLTPKIDFSNREIEENHHREIRTQNALLRADLDFGLTDRLTLAARIPFFNQREHEHFDDAGTPSEEFTRQAGGSGFGDVQIGLRYAFVVGARDLILGGLSVKAPTGTYKLRDGEGDINEPSLQPGTGSYDVIGSLHYRRQLRSERSEWFVAGSYRANGENDLDYRIGDEAQAHAGFVGRFARRAEWQVQLNLRERARDAYIGEKVPSTGSTYLTLSPGLAFTAGDGLRLYGFLQVPVRQDVNETQLAPRTGILIGISRTFG